MAAQSFQLATKIIFGNESLQQLPDVGVGFGEKVLVVTGKNALTRNGVLNEVTSLLNRNGYKVTVWAEVEPEPTIERVNQGLNLAREIEVDWVIGLGGGSAMDAAKVIAGLYNESDGVRYYFNGGTIQKPGIPLITIPTIAGSGAEVTVNAVLSDVAQQLKQSIRHPFLAAKVTLVDPLLTLDVPREITVYSGFDALVQGIEAYTSTGANPITDLYALGAIEQVGNQLLQVAADGRNIPVRTALALGSLMAGVALTNARLGAVHGMAHSIGIRTRKPHGLVCAILLVPVLRFNLAVCDQKYAQVAKVLGHNIAGMDTIDASVLGIKTIMAIQKKLGIPTGLHQLGLAESDFEAIVAESMNSGSLKANPRPVKPENLLNILKESY